MHDHVGYLCGALELDEITVFEQILARDGELRRLVELHRKTLILLDGDREDCCPPQGLAARCCERIRTARTGDPPRPSSPGRDGPRLSR